MDLAEKHAVEVSIIGRYTDSGALHLLYQSQTCAYIDIGVFGKRFSTLAISRPNGCRRRPGV